MRGSATPSTPLARAEQRHEPGLEPGLEPGKHGRPVVARSGVLLAYSHRDRDLLGELQVHLKPLQKAWTELQRAVEATRVVVLLVSPAFLSSTFVAGHALPALLAGQEHPRAAVMCVYLRPALDVFAESRFVDPSTGAERSVQITSFRGLNDPLNPLAALEQAARHEVLQAAAAEIIKAAHRSSPVVTQ